ncbi:MAG: DUF2520 domain-containing protein [Candidatus Brocadiaceae bacterium]|jgi:predicted short-subunit dehydrogenase-like oxidoreductase (DUF2520 family)
MTARFAIVGAGKVGTALVRLLVGGGWEFAGAASRSLESAQRACSFAGCGEATTDPADVTQGTGLVFLTVPDDAIRAVCDELAERGALGPGSVVAHCSGALTSAVLQSAAEAGASVGSLHPMQSFATVEQALQNLPGSCCCIEGDASAVEMLREVAEVLGAAVVTVPTESKPLYHAAGCVASNYLVALQNAALKLNRAAGISRDDALKIMLPLLRGTLDNFARVGLPDCLTGPIARGDVETVRRHLEAIQASVPGLLDLYKVLGLEAVEVAEAKGTLSAADAEKLRGILSH